MTRLAGLLWCFLIVGCSGAPVASPSTPTTAATPSTTPSGPGSPTTAGISSSPAPTSSLVPPTPTLEPEPSSTPPTSSRGIGLNIEWQRQAADFGGAVEIVKSAVLDDRIVVIGNRSFSPDEYSSDPAIWWEDGDLVWRLAELPPTDPDDPPYLSNIVAGGPGLVAVGSESILWVSLDGRSWEAVDTVVEGDEWGRGMPEANVLAAASDGLVARGHYDSDFSGALVSPDARHWRKSTDPTTQKVVGGADLLVGSGNELTAFVYEDSAVQVWRSAGIESWTEIGELPVSRGVTIESAAVGPLGWIVAGNARGPIAWTSRDGFGWELAESPPYGGQFESVFGVAAGFVGVTIYNPGAGGCVVEEDWHTVTWTSSDGHIWRQVGDMGDRTRIESLRRRGRQLIGIGTVEGNTGAIWTARLPENSQDSLPAPTPPPVTDPDYGC